MQKFDFIPTKKTFHQDFILETSHLFTLTYEQATLWEFFEFYSKPKEEQIKDVVKIINDCIPYTRIEKIKKKYITWYKTEIEEMLDYDKLIINILNNRFRTYNSIFDGVKTWISKNKNKWFMRNSFAQVCSFWNIWFTELLEKYTIEQFLWMLDWVRFEANSQSKDGQNINNMALQDVKWRKQRAEETRKAFENFKF